MSFPTDGYHLGAGEGDPWWFLDTRMTVKVGGPQSAGGLTLIEFSAPAGFGPPRHVHADEDEMFYVLEGQLRVVCGAEDWQADPGSLVFLPRRIEHAFVVTGQQPVRALQITTPAQFEDYIAELGRRPSGPGLPEPQAPDVARLAEVSARYGTSIVGPPLAGA